MSTTTVTPAKVGPNPFAQLERVSLADLEAKGRPDHPDHRTPVQKAEDQARTDAEGFPRGLRRF